MFTNSDPLCGWSGFRLTKFDNQTQAFVPFEHSLIQIDAVKRDITVQTDSKLNTSFFLNVTTVGGPWQAHKFNVFICGSEEVKVQSAASKMTFKYDHDSAIGNVPASKVLESFSSTVEKCAVKRFDLVKGKDTKGSKDLDQGTVTLDSDSSPRVSFNFKQAFDSYEKVQLVFIRACTHAKVCGQIEVVLEKITCDDSSLLSDGVPIFQQVTEGSEPKIGGSAFKSSFLATNPKCLATKFGLLWVASESPPLTSLDDAISMDESGTITINSAAIFKMEKASVEFEIVALTDAGKRAFKHVNLDVVLPEKPEEATQETNEEQTGNQTEEG